MPLFFQQDIDADTKLAVWKIEESEDFFLQKVTIKKELTHPHKRLQHLAGRYLLAMLFPDFPLSLIQIADTRKPFLEDEAYHFSISHCGDYAGAIVSKTKRVGLDIEIPTQKVEKIKAKFLHQEELDWLAIATSVNNDNPILQSQSSDIYKLTLLWSCKEALFKWWSYGGVDFREMMRIQPFVFNSSGSVNAHFNSNERKHLLTLNYKLFHGLCLAWIAE